MCPLRSGVDGSGRRPAWCPSHQFLFHASFNTWGSQTSSTSEAMTKNGGHIRSDCRVIFLARATAILLVRVGTNLGGDTFGGRTSSSGAGTRPIFEEGVQSDESDRLTTSSSGTRTPCWRNIHSLARCERFFCISGTSYVTKRLPTHDRPCLLYCWHRCWKMSYRAERY